MTQPADQQMLPLDDDAATAENRGSDRAKVIKYGQIFYRHGHCEMECVVLDLSDNGAKLRPADIVACPDTFLLKIKFGPTRPCEVVWQKGNNVGVRFTD